ncbi:hypothetical protein [Sulfitobacter sp. R18_1]|uniref:hypothetical protein n=1 Tax=Sulfitobacter sp. R18_1 TaxID=2821104 RepID=UPI001ADC43CD|nr:hypothetical protein [Sulfitobacter sp. R18_1]MBO9428181.1 hypothetical protein [Sulfitobacter sp. R18_1]
MTTNDTLIVMTADQLKAIINKTLKNAKNGKESNQTSLTDAAKLLGVDGNWGTALSKGSVIAPGVDLASIAAPSAPAQPSSFKVYLNGFDLDGKFSMSAHATQEAADRDARNWLKGLKNDYPEVDYDQEYVDDIIEEMREVSDYAIRVMQENFELSPPQQGPEAPEDGRIEAEQKAIENGEVDYLQCDFIPQEFFGRKGDDIRGVGVSEDAEWKMTVEEALQLTNLSSVEDIQENSYDSDHLRLSRHAPEWVRDWDGPFEVEFVVHKATPAHESMTAEDRVRDAADDAFIHIQEAEMDEDLMRELDITSDAFRKKVVDEWMKLYGDDLAMRIDYEGAQIVNDHVYDGSYTLMEDELQEMLDAKKASNPAP